MSEVQSRTAPRGRSSARGGRGGHGSRGPRSNKQTNGEHTASPPIDTSADQGELGELKRRYQSQLSMLKELFPDWTDADLVLAIEESDGDLQATVEKISEGNISQFAEVKKTKDRSRSKVKDAGTAAMDAGPTSRGETRRGRGGDSVRGGRGRGTERGRGGFRGSRGGAANGARPAAATSVPTVESPVWETSAVSNDAKENDQVATGGQTTATHVPDPEAPKPAVAAPPKKTWASMFATPKPAPTPPKPIVQQPPPMKEELPTVPVETPAHDVAQEPTVEAEELPIPPVADEVPAEPLVAAEETPAAPPELDEKSAPDVNIAPPKAELTKDNVEHLPDVSHPPATETAASTVASKDIGSVAGVATPLSLSGQPPIGRPAPGGFATTALKATGIVPHRSASFQKKHLEQQEAVVMPGNHAIDRATVQFGSMGLNGELDASDIDEDREEAETRTQPPQHSPVAQPRASLPPAPRQAPPAMEAQQQESQPTPKQAPGLPPVQQQSISQQSPQNPLAAQAMLPQGSQGSQQYSQFGRYGSGLPTDTSAPPQKPYDAFGQQAPQSSQYDYPSHQQNQNLTQQTPHSQAGAFSSAPDAFASQYLTSDQQRSAYQNYYANYNQQNPPSQQEAGTAQQRTGSAFGSGPSDSTFPPSQQQQVRQASMQELRSTKPSGRRLRSHGSDSRIRARVSSFSNNRIPISNFPPQTQGRYNDTQNSGHTTPNPALGGQHPGGPGSQGLHQPHAQPGAQSGYPGYNHPYYNNPYYANYMNQFGGYGHGGYGGFGKGMYGQPHHYGMSPQASFDQHSSSPANVGSFGQSHGRDGGLGGGLSDYSRSVSAAPQNQHGATAGTSGFGGFPDSFGRSQGGYPSQPSSYGQQPSSQQGEDTLKPPFGDPKSGGPSPSALGTQPGRPGSATNNTQGQSTQGLPNQQGFGGYQSHLGGQGNQYGGLGGLGHPGAGGHQAGSYGSYGGFGGGGYGSYNRGGWGTNYGQH
ncbi:hypothetical protein CC78DRAFT_581096 [Lojkania enalia]|uniref:RNA polymerase II degradation factor 1 n=1 Tax=Lojkania enalia TaxID=147567 RepID=A0A9P4K7W3_9PLEO|nr:hypothetical protein CC78DRAFT_581096 [Didymosphaeria enalia]